jgi:hypothetical protein
MYFCWGSVFPYRRSLTIRFFFFRSHPYSFLCTYSVPSSVGVRLFVYLGSPVVVSTYFCWGVEFFRIFGPVSDISTYFGWGVEFFRISGPVSISMYFCWGVEFFCISGRWFPFLVGVPLGPCTLYLSYVVPMYFWYGSPVSWRVLVPVCTSPCV